MRTSLVFLVLLAAAGCALTREDADVTDQGALTNAQSAGIVAGSLEAEGVVIYANDRAVGVAELTTAGVTPTFAAAIVGARVDRAGNPSWLPNLAALEALSGSSAEGFGHLLARAKAGGDVEAPGFDPPSASQIVVPPGLGHPPAAADVIVQAGFDGKTPAEVQTIVRSRLTNTVDQANERFTNDTIRQTHKAFTIALGNLFVSGSPPAAFASGLGADAITLLGTMSSVTPTIVEATRAGAVTYFARGEGGTYAAIPTPHYPVIMRARVALQPQGVRVFYPAWSAPVLRGPTGTVTESP